MDHELNKEFIRSLIDEIFNRGDLYRRPVVVPELARLPWYQFGIYYAGLKIFCIRFHLPNIWIGCMYDFGIEVTADIADPNSLLELKQYVATCRDYYE